MKIYRTNKYGCQIDEVEAEKKTEKTVWIKGRRSAIVSDYHRFFDSYDEAKEWLIDTAKKKIDSANFQVELAESFLKNVKNEKGPVAKEY